MTEEERFRAALARSAENCEPVPCDPPSRVWADVVDRMIDCAEGLLSEQIRDPAGEANPEYARGIVELIVDVAGFGMEFRDVIARRIGLPDVD